MPRDADGLTPQQRRFVEEYLVDLNGAAAARRAGYSARTASHQAPRLLANVGIQRAIADGRARQSERLEASADDVVRELMRLAFADHGDIMDFSGEQPRLRPAHAIPERARRAIASIKVQRRTVGTGDDAREVEVIEYKLWDKNAAIKTLAQHLGMLVQKVAPVNPDGTTPYDGGSAGALGSLIAELRQQLERRRGAAGGEGGQPTGS